MKWLTTSDYQGNCFLVFTRIKRQFWIAKIKM
nr:MAG TPA: hypothetical protein [Caudoviricetes sp.]